MNFATYYNQELKKKRRKDIRRKSQAARNTNNLSKPSSIHSISPSPSGSGTRSAYAIYG